MTETSYLRYTSIAEAIDYIQPFGKGKTNLDELAKKLQLSPADFQQLFMEWAGTSPTKFLQYTSIDYAKNQLKGKQITLFDTAEEISISDASRQQELIIQIEPMLPAEYENGGESLSINYSYGQSQFGSILIASTQKGICHLAFLEDKQLALSVLQQQYPKARFNHQLDPIQQNAFHFFNFDRQNTNPIPLHLKGTEFQLNVWTALLKISIGQLSTYGNIAKQIGKPTASRAVGTAIGDNPVAFLIPCHRVIQSSGKISGYMWGTRRKIAIIGWEAARINRD